MVLFLGVSFVLEGAGSSSCLGYQIQQQQEGAARVDSKGFLLEVFELLRCINKGLKLQGFLISRFSVQVIAKEKESRFKVYV